MRSGGSPFAPPNAPSRPRLSCRLPRVRHQWRWPWLRASPWLHREPLEPSRPPSPGARVPALWRLLPAGVRLPSLLFALELQCGLSGSALADLWRRAIRFGGSPFIRFGGSPFPSRTDLITAQIRQISVLAEAPVRARWPPEHDARLRHGRCGVSNVILRNCAERLAAGRRDSDTFAAPGMSGSFVSPDASVIAEASLISMQSSCHWATPVGRL
jgi:hypothetical protein